MPSARRRIVQPDLPEDVVEDLIKLLFASTDPVKRRALPPLRAALLAARAPRVVAPPKRLAFFHDYCELSPDAQAVVADVAAWLRVTRADTRQRVRASLDVLVEAQAEPALR